jgi:plasmid stabilization system protein ParE
MVAKPVEFDALAATEYQHAFEWYLSRSETAASRFANEIERAISVIAQRPQMHPAGPSGVRKFILRGFPFIVVYRDLVSTIQVIAIAHGHRRPGYWKDRLRGESTL